MFQSIVQHVSQNAIIYVIVAMTILFLWLVIALIRRRPEDTRLWFMGLRYKTPVIGKVASLGRRTEVSRDGWFQSEITLCDAFYAQREAYYSDSQYYEKAVSYLQKVQEYGRRPMNIWHWLMIIVFTAIEAVLFAVVILDTAVPGNILTSNMALAGGGLIGLIIAGVFAWLAHKTGTEMHRGDLIRKARSRWAGVSDGESSKLPIVEASRQVGIFDNEKDDGEPQYIQILNRIEHNENATPGDKKWIWPMVVLTLFIAFTIVGIRFMTYQEDVASDIDISREFGAPEGELESGPEAESELAEWAEYKGILTYVAIALVFIILQYISVFLVRAHALVGHDSHKAYRLKRRFETTKHFESWQQDRKEKVSSMANEMLTRLQEKIRQRVSNKGTVGATLGVVGEKRDFDDYLRRRKLKGIRAEGVAE